MALGAWARRNAVASATIGALATLLLLAEWRLGHSRRALDAALQKLVVEQQHGLKLRRKIKRFGEPGGAQPQADPARTRGGPPTLLSSTGNGSAISASELLEGHRRWDWRAIATDFLQRWPSIESQQLETAVETCANNGTMYCQRLQVHGGKMYLTDYRAIFFDRHYAPARVMPLLAALRRHPDMPDIDIVVAGNDEPKVPSYGGDRSSWSRTCNRWPGDSGLISNRRLPPVMFANTVNPAVMDLPWLDFSWYLPRRPHKLRTPPWSLLHPQLVAAGGSVKWEDKVSLAMHTGNVGSPQRKQLAKAAQADPDVLLVNELFIGDHAKISHTCRELGLDRVGGYQQHKCFMRFEDQCRYKYLLNTASVGFANKFKSLLLCGSVVLYIRDGMRHKEFYEYGLLPGVHYVAVDTAADVPATVRWLRANEGYARAVAAAGRERMATLDEAEVTNFVAEMLRQYSTRQRFQVSPQPGAVRIECEDDLWRHYALSKGWANNYIFQDNSTCVHGIPPLSKLGPPGWGGAYAGSKPRCLASHDLGSRAQPTACNFAKPFSTSESWEPWGQFPNPHPNDPEKWLEPPCEGCYVPPA